MMTITVGIRKEVKQGEGRVVLTPDDLRHLVKAVPGDVRFLCEAKAGLGSDFSDEMYVEAGATIVPRVAENRMGLFDMSDLVVGVKEPLTIEWPLIKEGQIHFAFFHFPASRPLYDFLRSKRVTAIAFEGIEEILPGGVKSRPILAAMSEVAAEYSILAADKYYCQSNRKPWEKCAVAVFGAKGVLGRHAMKKAAEKGALTFGFDIFADKEETSSIVSTLVSGPNSDLLNGLRGRVMYPSREVLEFFIPIMDIFITAAASRNAPAPKILTADIIALMKPGSFIADPSIDEGGCTVISRPTSHAEPVIRDTSIVSGGILYCGVPNMPGGLPRMATEKISGAVSAYLLRLLPHINPGGTFKKSILGDEPLAKGFVLYQGQVVDASIAGIFSDEFIPFTKLLI